MICNTCHARPEPHNNDVGLMTCRRRVDEALKILGTDYIDILTLRLGAGSDAKGIPLEETARGMKVHYTHYLLPTTCYPTLHDAEVLEPSIRFVSA